GRGGRATDNRRESMHPAPASVAIPGYPAGTWKADPVHSEIAFSVRHLMISRVRGRFTGFDVTIVTSEDLLSSAATATIDLASVDTGHATRAGHLRPAAPLAVATHPTLPSASLRVRPPGDALSV